mgnify:FL=1
MFNFKARNIIYKCGKMILAMIENDGDMECYVYEDNKDLEEKTDLEEYIKYVKKNGEKVEIVVTDDELLGYIDNKTQMILVPDAVYIVDISKRKIFKYK